MSAEPFIITSPFFCWSSIFNEICLYRRGSSFRLQPNSLECTDDPSHSDFIQ